MKSDFIFDSEIAMKFEVLCGALLTTQTLNLKNEMFIVVAFVCKLKIYSLVNFTFPYNIKATLELNFDIMET